MTSKTLAAGLIAAALVGSATPSAASQRAKIERGTPVSRIGDAGLEPASSASWAAPALQFVKAHGYVAKGVINENRPVRRRVFKKMMAKAFGGGFSKTTGKVKAREVDAALVRALGRSSTAKHLASVKSPDGWDPQIGLWDGYEMVAREMGLRHDRPTSEEGLESSAKEAMLGADVAYAVWRAKVGPNTWGADELDRFRLDIVKRARARVVRYAFDQVGLPYIWGGEWAERTPAGYPYGAQAHGGVDCSGFVWYVLRANASNWQPKKRPYRGWGLADRSSSGMAAGTKKKIGYNDLKTGDIMTFASGGRSSGAAGVYHAGIYLGRGWMIDSAGSQAGVGLSYVGKGSWWRDQFVWGRRVIR
jgi:cell wall-associated NlpC family hydrolase